MRAAVVTRDHTTFFFFSALSQSSFFFSSGCFSIGGARALVGSSEGWTGLDWAGMAPLGWKRQVQPPGGVLGDHDQCGGDGGAPVGPPRGTRNWSGGGGGANIGASHQKSVGYRSRRMFCPVLYSVRTRCRGRGSWLAIRERAQHRGKQEAPGSWSGGRANGV